MCVCIDVRGVSDRQPAPARGRRGQFKLGVLGGDNFHRPARYLLQFRNN